MSIISAQHLTLTYAWEDAQMNQRCVCAHNEDFHNFLENFEFF